MNSLIGASPTATSICTRKHPIFPQLPRHLRPAVSVSLPLVFLHLAWVSLKAMVAPQPLSQSPAPGREKRAMISLSNKKGLLSFATALVDLGYTVVSTGGTSSALENAVTKVENITSFPELLDGHFKTLHPYIHAGILARRDQPSTSHGIGTIDVVVVDLYPFYEKVTSSEEIDFDDGVKQR